MDGLYTYVLVSTLYNESGNYIDCFLPFVISVIDSKVSNTSGELQGRIQEKYGLEIPEHSLKTILTRGKRSGYAKVDQKQYSLTDKGLKLKEGIEHKETRREINGFLSELDKHLTKDGFKTQQIEKIFQQYVFSNLRSIFFFLDSEILTVKDGHESELDPYITEFIINIEKTNSSLFKVFQNIVFGKIISLAISGTQEIGDLQQSFSKTTLFLDTNVVFDILGLQGNEAQKVTKEFVRLAQNSKKFIFKVFDFTVDEIIRVISNYSIQSHKYLSDVRVDSIYCHLKAKGWKNANVSHFIQNLEQKLKEKDIHVFKTKKPGSVVIFERVSKLSQFKPDKPQINYEHDLRSIHEVLKIRSNRVSKFERAKCFFLSQDFKLARFNFNEFGHKKYQSVPEVMLERTLTNLLWLKQPKDIPLDALISFHKKYAVVEKNVWEMFYEKILQAKESDKDFYDDTTTLLCHSQLQTTLANLEPSATKEDIETVVKKSASTVRQKEKTERDELLEKQKIEFEKVLDDQIEQVEAEKKSELTKIRSKNIETLIKHRDKAISKAIKKSNIAWNVIRATISLLIIIMGIIFLPKVRESWQYIEPVAWLFSIAVGSVLGIYGFNWTEIRPKLDEYFKQKKLKEIQFEELMQNLDVKEKDLE